MQFCEFLKRLREKKLHRSSREQFEDLGGESVLGVTLRRFQQIESGQSPPTVEFLAAVFPHIPPSETKDALLAFFSSAIQNKSNSKLLLVYLENCLYPELERETKSIWDNKRIPRQEYSSEQLHYLLEHEEAFRFFKKVLIRGPLDKSKVNVDSRIINDLKRLGLIEFDRSNIKPSSELFKLPIYGESNPKMLHKTTDYILKHLDAYISKEGSTKQALTFGMQTVSPDVADKIIEQTTAFKKWVQSLAKRGTTGDKDVTIVHVGFSKRLEDAEL